MVHHNHSVFPGFSRKMAGTTGVPACETPFSPMRCERSSWGLVRKSLSISLVIAFIALLLNPTFSLLKGPRRSLAAAGVIYVDPASGNDAGSGTAGSPFRTLQRALQLVEPGGTIKLASGVYQEVNQTVRAGTASSPIVIEPADGAKPVLDGKLNTLNAIRIVHSYYTLRGIEIRNTKEGVRIERASGVVLENNKIHHVNNEGLRLHFFAVGNTVRNNIIWATGLAGNAEGIYLGTAPEQRYKNGGLPDTSTHNVISGNEIYNAGEGIDIKEDSSFNTVAGNILHDNFDPLSGGINVRSDSNYLFDNLSYSNAGAGYRFGGDVTFSPDHGDNYHYGVNNVLRNNIARNNGGHGYKFMNGPQYTDVSNTGSGNAGVLMYHGAGVPPCIAGPAPAPSPLPSPSPTATPVPIPAPVAGVLQSIPGVSQALGADGVVLLNLNVNRVRDPSTGVDGVVPGGITYYGATLTYPGGNGGNVVNVMGVRGVSPFSPAPGIDPAGMPGTSGNMSITGAPSGAAPQAPLTLAQVAPRILGSSTQSHNIQYFLNNLTDGLGANMPADSVKTFAVRRGDARMDGLVNITDALFVAQYLAGIRGIGEGENLVHAVNAASVKADGPGGDIVNITDALFIAQMLAGLRDDSFVASSQ